MVVYQGHILLYSYIGCLSYLSLSYYVYQVHCHGEGNFDTMPIKLTFVSGQVRDV